MNFLVLLVTLPTRQSAGRMRVWRALRALGCATLRDGVYLLPESAPRAAALTAVIAEVVGVQGSADCYTLSGRDPIQQGRLAALFDRGEEYARLKAAIAAAQTGDAKGVRGLCRAFSALAAIDFYPGESQRQTEEALSALEAAATGEPVNASGKIRRLEIANFQGCTWATRKNLWVDRMASAWLIRRFIDIEARFLWLDDVKHCPKQAQGFDFDGACFTHVDGRVTFEVLVASFGLGGDPAIVRLAAIVHSLDVGGLPVPEAAGLEALLAGMRAASRDDDVLLNNAGQAFDFLYAHFLNGDTENE